jgi:hypothetical protein
MQIYCAEDKILLGNTVLGSDRYSATNKNVLLFMSKSHAVKKGGD